VTAAEPVTGCACTPSWPRLVVHTGVEVVMVEPAATPGGLACLFHARCADCGMIYPGPFRVPPRAKTNPGCRTVRGASTPPWRSSRVHPTDRPGVIPAPRPNTAVRLPKMRSIAWNSVVTG